MNIKQTVYKLFLTVGFQETNLVGNVYFANYIFWQGKCREKFLYEKVPNILSEIENGLSLITLKSGCNHIDELRAFDSVSIEMILENISYNKISMSFEYYKIENDKKHLVAEGFHEIGCYLRSKSGNKLEVVSIPLGLKNALIPYLKK